MSPPIIAPARGYVFNFHVWATFIWSSDGLPREMLSSYAQYFMPYAIRALTRTTAARARNFAPHRARELEVELQRALSDMGVWRYERAGIVVACQPHVWVQMDERVKQAVLPYWEQLIKLDCAHDVDMKRAQYAERLSRQWAAILEKLSDIPFADSAAKMTDEELASVVHQIIAEKKATGQRAEDLLREKMHSDDPYERAEAFDTLVDRHKRQNGAAPAEPSR